MGRVTLGLMMIRSLCLGECSRKTLHSLITSSVHWGWAEGCTINTIIQNTRWNVIMWQINICHLNVIMTFRLTHTEHWSIIQFQNQHSFISYVHNLIIMKIALHTHSVCPNLLHADMLIAYLLPKTKGRLIPNPYIPPLLESINHGWQLSYTRLAPIKPNFIIILIIIRTQSQL